MLDSFEEFGKYYVRQFNKKYDLPTDLLCWRAAVFWLCKGSIIISSLIVIWYEWFDETCAVLNWLTLVFRLKFLNVFMGREDPIDFDISIYHKASKSNIGQDL
jgi:hypothetical protein